MWTFIFMSLGLFDLGISSLTTYTRYTRTPFLNIPLIVEVLRNSDWRSYTIYSSKIITLIFNLFSTLYIWCLQWCVLLLEFFLTIYSQNQCMNFIKFLGIEYFLLTILTLWYFSSTYSIITTLKEAIWSIMYVPIISWNDSFSWKLFFTLRLFFQECQKLRGDDRSI